MGMTNEDRRALKAPGAVARLAYSIAESCYQLNCGKTKLYELIAAGRLDARALDGKTLITAASLRALVESLPTAPIGGQKQQEV